MRLIYNNYEGLSFERELERIKSCDLAEIHLEPNNKKCLFILGMLFAYGIPIKILNEKKLNLEETNKSFSMMPYVWSKIGDSRFPNQFYTNVKTEMDNRVENAKRMGIKLEPIKNHPTNKKIFLICPVRNATENQRKWIENYVEEKMDEGYTIHAPHLNTRQSDLFGGYAICKQNAEAVASSEKVDIYYDQSSTGSVFDLGVAYALQKPLVLLNEREIQLNQKDLIDKTISNWPYHPIREELSSLRNKLTHCWSKNTCSPGLRKEWNEDNQSLGQCAITALIVNDHFGGKIMRCMSPTGSHYYNEIDGNIIDLTVDQFQGEIPKYESGQERTRDYLLSNLDTKKRYQQLKEKLISIEKPYKLVTAEGKIERSSIPGTLGGNKKLKIYGKLDCPSAKRWIDKGYYKNNRVFFIDEQTAIDAGYRPCAICMPKEYKEWQSRNKIKAK